MTRKRLGQGLVICAAIMATWVSAANAAGGKTDAAACTGCHGNNGIGVAEEFPNLAGQKAAYLVKQLKAFKDGTRHDPTMGAMAAALSDHEIVDLADHFASLEPVPTVPAVTATEHRVSDAAVRASAMEFPAATFVTLKKDAGLVSLPREFSWKGGPNMLYSAVTPDGKRVLATSPSSDAVYVFDSKNGRQLAVIKTGKAPKGVKVTPSGRFAYVSNQGSADITVIDLATLKAVDAIAVEAGPHNARFTSDGRLAYVTLQGGAGIAVIDTATRKMLRVIPVPGITGPHNLDLSADEKTAFVRDFVHHVAVLDLQNGDIKKVIKVGNGHGGIDVTPDGRYAVTAAIGDRIITVIDTKTLAATNLVVGNGPHGIRASRDSHWLYVTLTKEDAVAVINMQTLRVEKKIAVGRFPFWVAVQGNP